MKWTVAMLALAVLAACGGSAGDEQAFTAGTSALGSAAAAPAAAPTAPSVTDPQIAAIVVAANDVDIRAGELARERAASPEVKAFAERMVTDHTGVNRAAAELVGRLGVTPEPNPTSQSLTRDGEQARDLLQGQAGAAFDRAYIDREVTYHQAVLDAIDQTLLPSAQNAELRVLLEQTRPAVEAHLQHARQLQGTLGGGA